MTTGYVHQYIVLENCPVTLTVITVCLGCGVKRMLILKLTNRAVWHAIVLCLQVRRDGRQYSCFQYSRMSCFGIDGNNANLRQGHHGRRNSTNKFCVGLPFLYSGFYLKPHLRGKQKRIAFAHEP